MNAFNIESIKGRAVNATSIRWAAYVMRRTLGLSGVIAMAALVALLGVDFLFVQPEKGRREAERDAQIGRLQSLPEPRLKKGRPGMTLRDVQNLHNNARAYSIFEILKNEALQRNRATYSRQTEVKGKLSRLVIDISVTGHYIGLREAMRHIADQPMTRIEQVVVERDDIRSDVINADLRVTLLGPDA